jgi:cytochrome P450
MTGAVDLTDLDMWARGVPYPEFARLRREAPVTWHGEAPPNSGFWSVLCYKDIVAASRDVGTFSSARGISFEEPTDEDMIARRTIIDTDPPEHTKLRKIVSGSFSQRAVAVYQHFVEQLTEHVLDAGLHDGELEFVDAVAKEVPIRVLARIMGLPEADLDTFIDLGDRLIANTDPDITDVVWGRDDTDAYRRFPFRSPVRQAAMGTRPRDRRRAAARSRGRPAAGGGRRRPAERGRSRQLLLDPGCGGERDHPDRDRPGNPRLLRKPGAVAAAAVRPWQ